MDTEDPPNLPQLSEGLGCLVVDPAKAVWSAKIFAMLKFPTSLIGQKDCQFRLNMISNAQIHGPKFFQMLGNRNYDLAPGNMFNGNRHMFELNDNQFVQNHLHSATIDSKLIQSIHLHVIKKRK